MYQVLAYIPLLAGIIWVGGMLFLALVLVPITRGVQQPGVGARVLGAAARRFRGIAWAALGTLIVTGAWMLLARGVDPAEIVTGRDSFFQALRIKIALAGAVLALSAMHDFVLGPRLARTLETMQGASTRGQSLSSRRRLVSWLARINLLLALIILALGMVIGRGTPS